MRPPLLRPWARLTARARHRRPCAWRSRPLPPVSLCSRPAIPADTRRSWCNAAARTVHAPASHALRTAHISRLTRVAPHAQHTYFAPALVKIKGSAPIGSTPSADATSSADYRHGDAGGLFIYVTPLEPGRTRVLTRRTVSAGTVDPPAVALASKLIVPAHLLLDDVFDGDLVRGRDRRMDRMAGGSHPAPRRATQVFLHAQERALREAAAADGACAPGAAAPEGGAWRHAYFLATAEDVGAACLRRWFDEVGGGGPFGDAPLPPREPSRRVLLDRWAQHAAHCSACRRAGQRADAAARGLASAAALAAAAAAAGLLAGAGASGTGPVITPELLATAAAAPALGAAAMAANRLSSLLRFKDYVHGRRT